MIGERRKVLTMLHEQKVSVEEAEGLLDALEQTSEPILERRVEYVTTNPRTQEMLGYARKAAPSNLPVLIVGETGTGKVVLARVIHQDSPRRDKPFIYANCALSPESLVDSELFGHERGAFTGAIDRKTGLIERANGGTLLLDSIDELPRGTQAKLLRFIYMGEFERIGGTDTVQVDVRLIAVTNKDLHAEVQADKFRQDLLDSLNAILLEVLPLRDRPEDIPLLADYFLKDSAIQSGHPVPVIASEAMDALTTYDWPGNARELARVMERALVLCDGETIQVEHLKKLES
ncbi:sigma 54-interacting transcriptional regulator [Candidatus Poribacteria bacterium]